MIPSDAAPGDVFTDVDGKLWRVLAICHQPTVTMEEVEGTLYDPNAPPPTHAMIGVITSLTAPFLPMRARIERMRREGSIGALMWHGFTRIWQRLNQKDIAA